MTKMKFLIKSLNGGGAEKVLIDFIREYNLRFGAESLDLLVLLKEGALLNHDLPNSVSYVYTPKNIFHRYYCLCKLLLNRRKIAKDYFDTNEDYIGVSFLEGWTDMILNSFKSKHTLKKVSWLHCNIALFKSISPVRLLFERYASRSDKLNCVSNNVKNMIPNQGRFNQIQVVYNFINLNNIRQLSQEYSPNLNIANDNFLFVGRLNYQKNIFLLLDSFSIYLESNSNSVLHIVGDGELLESLKKRCSDLEISANVCFHGFLKNPYPFIRTCDTICITSFCEGLPTVIIEAACLQTKVVSTKCGAEELLSLLDYEPPLSFEPQEYALGLGRTINSRKYHCNFHTMQEYFSFDAVLSSITDN